MGLSPKEVYDRVRAAFPRSALEVVEPAGDSFCIVPAADLPAVCSFLKETSDLDFDYLASVGGADDLTNVWVIYHLYSIRRNHRAVLKVKLDRGNPSVASLCPLWAGANWHERETYDMYGIRFEGHPDPRRILLPEDWTGFPLRKDYDFPDHYQGIPLK